MQYYVETLNNKEVNILYFSHYIFFQTKKYADMIIPRGADNTGQNNIPSVP